MSKEIVIVSAAEPQSADWLLTRLAELTAATIGFANVS